MCSAYRTLIWEEATKVGIDPHLVEAIIFVESSDCADAFRFEPKFWARYLAKLPEWKGSIPRRVSSSYGLMQIMFPVAKEMGFVGEPETLFLPSVNVKWGCKKLQSLLKWSQSFSTVPSDKQLCAAIASYNGGRGGNKPTDEPLRNGKYASKVLATMERLKKDVS